MQRSLSACRGQESLASSCRRRSPEAIEAGQKAEATVAVDITQGRRFWSVIGFQTGLTHDAEHLYYSHVHIESHFGECYPTIPRTATDLIDFTEVV